MKIHNFTVCDQVRVEDNGKFLLIGVYTNSILFPQLPAQYNCSFWMMLEHEEVGKGSFAFRGRMPDIDADLFEISGDMDILDTVGWTPVAFGAAMLIGQPGRMVIEARLNGSDWQEVRTIHIAKGPVPQFGRPPIE